MHLAYTCTVSVYCVYNLYVNCWQVLIMHSTFPQISNYMVDIFSCNCHTDAVSSAFVANHMGKNGYTVAVGIWGTCTALLVN